ncbi:hypothetical protein V5O48_014771 [Marasmius crinis-equi]|uniref:Uncharacterized protein n=1 Tax=Marasmius crinis-equi TaxID=585013 RepID=A0ABR3EWE8_9AGAR
MDTAFPVALRFATINNTGNVETALHMPITYREEGSDSKQFPIGMAFRHEKDAEEFIVKVGPIVRTLSEEKITGRLAFSKRLLASEDVMGYNLDLKQRYGKGNYYLDVRNGRNPGIYCNSVEAFRNLEAVGVECQRAYAFGSLLEAIISRILYVPHPPGAVFDYNPREFPLDAKYQRKFILQGLQPALGPGEASVFLGAEQSAYAWACFYMETHGYGQNADDVSYIQSLIDEGLKQNQFVEKLCGCFGEGRKKQYEFLFSLFQKCR